MCGIAGIIDLEASRDIDRNALRRMTNALAHRGPDGEGYYFAPGVGLGHRRLAIIDPRGGAQPFETSKRAGVLSFNGEIYNYRQLTTELRQAGVSLSTNSDTEVLAEGLAMFGAPFARRLRGMFAFAFWDSNKRTLLLARDRLGEKPLYYAITDDGFFLFASEIGSIAVSGLVTLDLDEDAVADYFFYGFVPDTKSIYKGVKKVPPGTYLQVDKIRKIKLKTYWRLRHSQYSTDSIENLATELLEKLDDAVHSQMISDAPLGAFLSGGLDSSSIVAAMRQHADNVYTCSIAFGEKAHDERIHASKVASRFNTSHQEEIVQIDVLTLIDQIALTYGEPFADSSALPSYILAKSARKHVKVALSGDGGDELFAGYRRHKLFMEEERVRTLLPKAIRQSVMGTVGAAYPKLDWAPRPFRLRTTLQMLAQDRETAYAHAVAANLSERSRRFLSPDFLDRLGEYRPLSLIKTLMTDPDEPALMAAQRVDMEFWLPGRILTKIDRASMAHGLEVRPPMLDHKFVEWAAAIPVSYKLNHGGGKILLKHAMRTRLPKEIVTRQKQGFSIPLSAWLRRPMGVTDAFLSSNTWRQSGLFCEREVESMVRNHKQGIQNNSQELWSLIMFDAFLRQKHTPRQI